MVSVLLLTVSVSEVDFQPHSDKADPSTERVSDSPEPTLPKPAAPGKARSMTSRPTTGIGAATSVAVGDWLTYSFVPSDFVAFSSHVAGTTVFGFPSLPGATSMAAGVPEVMPDGHAIDWLPSES